MFFLTSGSRKRCRDGGSPAIGAFAVMGRFSKDLSRSPSRPSVVAASLLNVRFLFPGKHECDALCARRGKPWL